MIRAASRSGGPEPEATEPAAATAPSPTPTPSARPPRRPRARLSAFSGGTEPLPAAPFPFSSTCWHFGFFEVVVVVDPVVPGFPGLPGLGAPANASDAASPATNTTARITLSFIVCLQSGVRNYLIPGGRLPCAVRGRSVVPQRPLGDRPPAGLALRQLALELADVQRQLCLLAVEPLLELAQLGAPALDALLAELDVGLELRLARLERVLALVGVAQASLELLLALGQPLLARREPDLLRDRVARTRLDRKSVV